MRVIFGMLFIIAAFAIILNIIHTRQKHLKTVKRQIGDDMIYEVPGTPRLILEKLRVCQEWDVLKYEFHETGIKFTGGAPRTIGLDRVDVEYTVEVTEQDEDTSILKLHLADWNQVVGAERYELRMDAFMERKLEAKPLYADQESAT